MPTKSYTGQGDKGHSSLGDGTRASKSHAVFEALGTLDELASVVGLAESGLGFRDGQLEEIQRDLFEAGAQLSGATKTTACGPGMKEGAPVGDYDGSFAVKLARLEKWIDEMDAQLPELKHFILAGGCPLSARLHHCRTVCRRAERRVEACGEGGKPLLPYINRLSSYFFTRARLENRKAGVADIVWQGKKKSD